MKYILKQNCFAWGEDFIIRDAHGHDVYFIDGRNIENYRLLKKMKVGIIIPIFQIDQVLKDHIISQQMSNIHFLKKYYWYHLALPLSCLIAVLLAAPLSFSSQRSGVMAGILQSLVLMVVFICFREFFMTLNQIPPLLAGTLPTIIFLVVGIIGLTKKT